MQDAEELVSFQQLQSLNLMLNLHLKELKKGIFFHKIEFIAGQSLRLRIKIVKELDFGVDIDLKGIGFVETGKAKTGSETVAKSSSKKIVREVSPKENIKDTRVETKTYKLFFFKIEQSLVGKSKYLSENQSVFLRKDPHSTEELKN